MRPSPTTTVVREDIRTRTRGSRGGIDLARLAAAVSAVLALVPAPLHITGWRATDIVVLAGLGAVVPLITARARRTSWFIALGLAAVVVASTVSLLAAGVGLVVAVVGTVRWLPHRTAGLLVGAALMQALVHADPGTSATGLAIAGPLSILVVVASAYRASDRKRRHRSRGVAGALLVGAAGIGLLLALALLSVRTPLQRGTHELDVGLAAARRGDQTEAQAAFSRAAAALHSARDGVEAWWAQPTRALPVIGRNVAVADAALQDAARLADDASASIAAVGPERLKVTGGGLDMSAVNQAQPIVDQAVSDATAALEHLDGQRSPWVVAPLRTGLDKMSERISRNLDDLTTARDAVHAAPDLLGDPTPRRYLILFVTPVEARANGFPGNFAELNVDHGQLSLGRFGRISELRGNQGNRSFDAPADYTARYGYLDTANEWRDITVSPDFPTVARLMGQLYPQSGGTEVDGVLRIDPVGLAALLRFTGPIAAPGAPFPLTKDNAAQYLLEDQYLIPANEDRIDALDDFGHLTFEKLVKTDLPGPGELAKVFAPLVSQGHLAFVRFEEASEALLQRVGATGSPPPVLSDSLGVIVNNSTGGKQDVFLTRDVDYRAVVDPTTGRVEATATIRLQNAAPPSGLPLYIIGNAVPFFYPGETLPLGTNRTWLTVYSPLTLAGATLDGAPVSANTAFEIGRLAHSLFIDIPPGGTRELTLTLAGQVQLPYEVDVWRQALAKDGRARVTIEGDGGSTTVEQPLDEDRTYRPS
ncbi:MAG: DUF4012 domain-containing protein [Acidimicrobiales bacterium]